MKQPHFEQSNLPPDVKEIYFSGRLWYAASAELDGWKRPKHVGSGRSRDSAINDMRRLSNDRKD